MRVATFACRDKQLSRLFIYLFAGFLFIFSSGSRADDAVDATNAAKKFNALFESNKMADLYDDFAGEFIRSKITRAAFIAQLSINYSALGGPAVNRSTVQVQDGKDPNNGAPMYLFRYDAKFPAARVYQDLTLIKEDSGRWKLYGIFFYPHP